MRKGILHFENRPDNGIDFTSCFIVVNGMENKF